MAGFCIFNPHLTAKSNFLTHNLLLIFSLAGSSSRLAGLALHPAVNRMKLNKRGTQFDLMLWLSSPIKEFLN